MIHYQLRCSQEHGFDGWFKDSTGSTDGAFLILASVSAIAAALCVTIRRHPALRSPGQAS